MTPLREALTIDFGSGCYVFLEWTTEIETSRQGRKIFSMTEFGDRGD